MTYLSPNNNSRTMAPWAGGWVFPSSIRACVGKCMAWSPPMGVRLAYRRCPESPGRGRPHRSKTHNNLPVGASTLPHNLDIPKNTGRNGSAYLQPTRIHIRDK